MRVKQTGKRTKQGGICFALSGVEKCAIVRTPDGTGGAGYFSQPLPIVVVGYSPYTGHWYLFNTESGESIATLTPYAYEHYVKPLRSGDLKPGCDE